MIDASSERLNEYPQVVKVRTHSFRADIPTSEGGSDSAPSPHDYFDASLATCKATTALWYAKRNNIPLERIEVQVERDDSQERKGIYTLKTRVAFHGAELTEAQRQKLHTVVDHCPVHKLMTTSTVEIQTTVVAAISDAK